MKRLSSTIGVAVAILAAGLAGAQQTVSQTRARVETLASEKFEGRLAGSNGERLAGEYIALQLQALGARPLPGRSDFFLPFEFTAGTRFELSGSMSQEGNVRALSVSDNGDAEGNIVFAGYGIVVPESQNFGYD